MGFSSQEYHQKQVKKRWQIHPIWRGIGCALIIIIPVMAWFGSQLILPQIQNIRIVQEGDQTIKFPLSGIPDIDKYITKVNQFCAQNGLTLGQVYMTVALTILGFSLLSFVYGVVYRMAGPSRFGPYDVPPNKV